MRLSRFVMLCLGTAALSACGKDTITTPALPPLAQVRFINAVADTGSVDIHAIDQVNLSPIANNLAYTKGTPIFPHQGGDPAFPGFPHQHRHQRHFASHGRFDGDAARRQSCDVATDGKRPCRDSDAVGNRRWDNYSAAGQVNVRLVNTAPKCR